MKLALVRCLQTEEICNGRHCLEYINNKEGSLHGFEEEIELVDVITCGGCPGNKFKARVEKMLANGVDSFIFASCTKLGTPIDYPCPHFSKLKSVVKDLSESVDIYEWTHQKTYKDMVLYRLKNKKILNQFKRGYKI
ncbi:CGGC domain-containing protein [Halanaerobiaceae bacterium Z-7014]|uniref:CGGC domain-containing protein n=1 Tax=Halonatronomonas betaini TaxID=2778430 RepID=A0A931F8Y4_9FIRM|nr:CGGC domain-containing protein [Halonatronomonas betaini]